MKKIRIVWWKPTDWRSDCRKAKWATQKSDISIWVPEELYMQDLPRIDQSIKDGSLEKNPVLNEMIDTLKANGKAAHVMGLMSPGGVHSSQHHIVALCEILAKNGIKVWVHAFLDGRDTPPASAEGFLADFEKSIAALKDVKIATIEGKRSY